MLNEKNAFVNCSLEYCKQINMKHQKVYTIVSVSISSSNYATLNTEVKLMYIKTNNKSGILYQEHKRLTYVISLS